MEVHPLPVSENSSIACAGMQSIVADEIWCDNANKCCYMSCKIVVSDGGYRWYRSLSM